MLPSSPKKLTVRHIDVILHTYKVQLKNINLVSVAVEAVLKYNYSLTFESGDFTILTNIVFKNLLLL